MNLRIAALNWLAFWNPLWKGINFVIWLWNNSLFCYSANKILFHVHFELISLQKINGLNPAQSFIPRRCPKVSPDFNCIIIAILQATNSKRHHQNATLKTFQSSHDWHNRTKNEQFTHTLKHLQIYWFMNIFCLPN